MKEKSPSRRSRALSIIESSDRKAAVTEKSVQAEQATSEDDGGSISARVA